MPSLPGQPCTNHAIKAYIYGSEHHSRPHFHLVAKDWDCTIDIETGEVIKGDPPAKERREAEEWRKKNLDLLRTKWRDIHAPE